MKERKKKEGIRIRGLRICKNLVDDARQTSRTIAAARARRREWIDYESQLLSTIFFLPS